MTINNQGVNSLISETETDTIKNLLAFVSQLSASLQNDPDDLGLLLSLQSVHNALHSLLK